MLGELPGRLMSGIQSAGKGIGGFMGFNDSMLTPQQLEMKEMTGTNPRREMWAAALSGLGDVGKGGGPATSAMNMQAQQRQMLEQHKQQQLLNQQKDESNRIAAINANKVNPTGLQKEADELYPDDQEAQNTWIEKMREKASTNVQPKGQEFMYKELIKEVPKARQAASTSADGLARVQTMHALIDELGNTGTGKSAMTSAKSFFNTVGASGAIDLIDGIAEVAGVDIWSGEQGAIELARALSNAEVLNRAMSLKGNTSDKDINFVKQASDILSMSDPNAQRALLDSQAQSYQRDLDYYGYLREGLNRFEGMPPLPEIRVQNRRGLGTNSEISDDKRKSFYDKYGLEMPK